MYSRYRNKKTGKEFLVLSSQSYEGDNNIEYLGSFEEPIIEPVIIPNSKRKCRGCNAKRWL